MKFGGILQFTTNILASRTVSRHSNKYGWFTSQTITGRNGKLLTTITAYRVTSSSLGTASAYAQQRVMLVTAGRNADPRTEIYKTSSTIFSPVKIVVTTYFCASTPTNP
jgi:hypothetical protein